jgi:hypothetical protein
MRVQHCLFGCLGQLDRDEVFLGIEIVFAGLVDDPQLIVPGGLFVGQKAIDFAEFERRGIVLVADAQNEPSYCWLRVIRPSA